MRLLLELGRGRIRAERNLDLAAKLLVRTYRYNTMAVFIEPFETQDEREAFIEELTALMVGYIVG